MWIFLDDSLTTVSLELRTIRLVETRLVDHDLSARQPVVFGYFEFPS